MEKHLNKRLIVLMLFVCLITQPWPGGSGWPFGETRMAAHELKGKPAHPCKAAKAWKYLAASNAFVFSFTPFTPVAIVFGVVALAAEGYEAIYC